MQSIKPRTLVAVRNELIAVDAKLKSEISLLRRRQTRIKSFEKKSDDLMATRHLRTVHNPQYQARQLDDKIKDLKDKIQFGKERAAGHRSKIIQLKEECSKIGSTAARASSERKRKATDDIDVARTKKAKKVSSPNTDASTSDNKGLPHASGQKRAAKRPADTDLDREAELPKRRKTCSIPKGLLNGRAACFANAGLQILNTALSDGDVDKLTGNAIQLDDYGLERKTSARKLREARERVARVARKGDVAISPYLGRILSDMRENNDETSIDPYVFQQVFAHSAPGEEKTRKEMDGKTQEDAHLWTSAMLDVVSKEDGAIADKFHVKHEIQISCDQAGCGKESKSGETAENVVRVHVPDKGEVSMKDLLQEALKKSKKTRLDGFKCEKCGLAGTSTRTEILTRLPTKLLVHVNRAPNGVDKSRKIRTKVALPFEDITLKGMKYRMTAMAKHYNRTGAMDNGHYTAFVLRNKMWFKLDDANVTKVEAQELADHDKSGQSDLILLQRMRKD